MRIIAGLYRGRKLKEFNGREVRPTSDRAREALFNILGNISGDSFLDLYCGTGAVGLEAASRGAEKVTLVDTSKESVTLSRDNAKTLNADVRIVNSDALSFVTRLKEKYDYIFLDPPYAANAEDVLAAIAENEYLKNAYIIYEHSGESRGDLCGLKIVDTRRYGVATFDFYEVKK